jgi:hypothetical protein
VGFVRYTLRYVTIIRYSATRRRLKKIFEVTYVSYRIHSLLLRGSVEGFKILTDIPIYSYLYSTASLCSKYILFPLDSSLIKHCYILYFVCAWSIEEKWIKYESVSILLRSENHFGRRYLQWNTLDTKIKLFNLTVLMTKPITVTARSEARSNTGIVCLNPTQGMDVCLLLFCVCVR